MPELQALNSLKEIVGLGAGAMMLTVIIAMFIFLRSQDKTRAKAEEIDALAANRTQELWQQTFAALTKAQDTKEQLEKLHDLREGELDLLQNHSKILSTIPTLVQDVNNVVQMFHKTQISIQEISLTTAQHMVDFMTEQKARFDTMDEKVDTIMDSNSRLVILLERLNANLERFNNNLEMLGGMSKDIQDIKGAILKTITDEQPAVDLNTTKPAEESIPPVTDEGA